MKVANLKKGNQYRKTFNVYPTFLYYVGECKNTYIFITKHDGLCYNSYAYSYNEIEAFIDEDDSHE